MVTMEDELAERTRKLSESEQKKKNKIAGLPVSEVEKLIAHLEKMRAIGEEYSCLSGIVDLSRVAAEIKEAIVPLPAELQILLQTSLEQIKNVLGNLEIQQAAMKAKLDAEIEQRQIMRQREKDTLDKLDKYLDQWI